MLRKFTFGLLTLLLALPAAAQTASKGLPNFPQILPAGTVVGRLPGSAGVTEAIPFSVFTGALSPFSSIAISGC